MDNVCIINVLFFFNDTATTEIYTLSLHDALPISMLKPTPIEPVPEGTARVAKAALRKGNPLLSLRDELGAVLDRKSTRLNSSHANISYAVFCLKKKQSGKLCT